MNNKFLYALLLSLLGYGNMQAQIRDVIMDLFATDSIEQAVDNADSIRIDELQRELDEARLNESNLRMEMEQFRLATFAQDSVKQAQQKLRIDSLRQVTAGIPVVVKEDTLFLVYAKWGGHSPQDRARVVSENVLELGKRYGIRPDSIQLEITEQATEIMYEGKVIASFTDLDGLWENMSRDELAAQKLEVIVATVKELKQEHGLLQLLKKALYFIGVIVLQVLLFRGVNWGFHWVKVYIRRLKKTRLRPISFHDYELVNTRQQEKLLFFVSNILRYIIILMLLLLTVPVLFSIFPQTEALALKIFYYIWNPVRKILLGIVEYIPNLFTIFVICYAIKYLVRGVRYLAGEIESEKLRINGFYPDWAKPTFYIIRFLLYAFMVAMIYPYLPGSQSGVFQGISVFVGLVVSLGSSTVIGNVIAGLIITYMRPFKMGDRIRLNETTGNVIEKTPFVTRLRTPKNEVVTIPNSFVMSSHTVNYSASARDYGLILHSDISVGYEVPFQRVHALLIEAALNTPGVKQDPTPFVFDLSLADSYPLYQINAYIDDADRMAKIYSDLHDSIQEVFAREGLELLSPYYVATRDGSELTVPPLKGKPSARKE